MKRGNFDRASQDVGNIIAMEHVNVTVPDQLLATTFYVNGLGLTRDPYMDFGPRNVWINAGAQQFHLPTSSPQVLRGRVGLIMPDLDALEARLKSIQRLMPDTAFSFKRSRGAIDVTCPWGNRIRCQAPKPGTRMQLGIPWIELDVPPGTAAGIARFYNQVLKAPASATKSVCRVSVGCEQELRFRESKRGIPDYDGHHIAIYITNFSGPHSELQKRKLITEESDAHQYRFTTLFDPENDQPLFKLEHEVRSLMHPMYARNLTNRNPLLSFAGYVHGRDAFRP